MIILSSIFDKLVIKIFVVVTSSDC